MDRSACGRPKLGPLETHYGILAPEALSARTIPHRRQLFRIRCKHRLDCRNPGLQAQAVEAALQLLSPSITNDGDASVLVVSAAPQLKPFNSIRFVMASIYLLSVCDSQPRA